MTCFQIYLLIKNFVTTVYYQVSVSLLAANICLSFGPETRTHTTYTACKQHFCIFLCVWFLHSSFCLCRVVLLPSVCAMASDVSKSGALKQSWRASAFASLQEFLAKFAPEIVQLQKKDLRSVANSSQSKKHAEWKQAQNFFLRHFDFLALEEKALLQDWELVLCDVSSLESVALLSGLQRCFERVDAFFKEHAEALKKLGAKNLDTALRSRHMAQFPMATFTRLFLERYEEQLETKQLQSMSTWKENLCAQRAPDEEVKSAKRRKAVLQLQEFFAKFAFEIVQLQKKDLRSVANSSQSKKHAEWKQAQNFFLRHFPILKLPPPPCAVLLVNGVFLGVKSPIWS